jgi:PAS domain S-box-containing protein
MASMRPLQNHCTDRCWRYRGLLEAAPDARVVMSHDGKIALVNAQPEVFGYWLEELLGQEIKMLMPEVRPMGTALELYSWRKDGTEGTAT